MHAPAGKWPDARARSKSEGSVSSGTTAKRLATCGALVTLALSDMTTCMVTYSFYEGDTRVMRYAEALAGRGDRVDVIALRRDGQSRREVVHGVNVYRIQRRSSSDGARGSYLAGILLFCCRAMFLLMRRHVRARYQLIHVHSVPDFLVFAAWFPKLTGTKIILDIHDLLPEFYASKYSANHDSVAVKLLRLTERASASFSDHVIAANDLWRERLVSRSVENEKCSAMVNVPDQAIFSPRGRTRTDDRVVLLYPGTLNWHQGLDIAIRAFALIKDKAPEAQFHIYGEGPCRSLLHPARKGSGITGSSTYQERHVGAKNRDNHGRCGCGYCPETQGWLRE